MEVPLTPFCISWRRGTELFFFHMSPKPIYIQVQNLIFVPSV